MHSALDQPGHEEIVQAQRPSCLRHEHRPVAVRQEVTAAVEWAVPAVDVQRRAPLVVRVEPVVGVEAGATTAAGTPLPSRT